jgi:hypothetical protein
MFPPVRRRGASRQTPSPCPLAPNAPRDHKSIGPRPSAFPRLPDRVHLGVRRLGGRCITTSAFSRPAFRNKEEDNLMRKDALLFGVGALAAGLWLLVNPPRSGAG